MKLIKPAPLLTWWGQIFSEVLLIPCLSFCHQYPCVKLLITEHNRMFSQQKTEQLSLKVTVGTCLLWYIIINETVHFASLLIECLIQWFTIMCPGVYYMGLGIYRKGKMDCFAIALVFNFRNGNVQNICLPFEVWRNINEYRFSWTE